MSANLFMIYQIHQNKTHPGAWNCRFHQGWERGETHHAGISSNQ